MLTSITIIVNLITSFLVGHTTLPNSSLTSFKKVIGVVAIFTIQKQGCKPTFKVFYQNMILM